MKKKKPIIVWMNGKKSKINQNPTMTSTHTFNKEHAASLDKSDRDNQIPALTRQHDKDIIRDKPSSSKSKFSMFKPIIFATISAIVIGLCMGIFMLNMFVGIGQEVNGSATNNVSTNTGMNNSSTSKTTESALTGITFEQINAFVLQAGVFSTEQNATNWAKNYHEAGFPTMVWKRDGQFYLLAGLSSTKEHGESLASNLKAEDFEIYVKEWNTAETEKQLTAEEGQWLHSFRDVWYESLMAVTGQGSMLTESWTGIIDSYPDQSDRLSALFEMINNSYKEISEANQQEAQIILLNQWKQYEESLVK